MVSTLQEMCYKKMHKTLETAPPVLQKIFMGETKKRMEERLRTEIDRITLIEVTKAFNLVPDMIENMIVTTVSARIRPNYMECYPDIKPAIIQAAVCAAEEAVRRMEERQIHMAFALQNRLEIEGEYTESDSSELTDSDDCV